MRAYKYINLVVGFIVWFLPVYILFTNGLERAASVWFGLIGWVTAIAVIVYLDHE